MNDNFEELAKTLTYDIPQVTNPPRPVILRSALQGEQNIAMQHHMHIQIESKIKQKLSFSEKPKTRARSEFTPIKSITTGLDNLVTRDNIVQHYQNKNQTDLLKIWDTLVGTGADRIGTPYTKITHVEKRVMDLILENSEAFQDGLDWTSKGNDNLLPENITLSRYSSKWIVFKYMYSIDSPTSTESFSKHYINWLDKIDLNNAIICVSVYNTNQFIFYDCDRLRKTFKALSSEEARTLRFEGAPFDYIYTSFPQSRKDLVRIDGITCVPSIDEPQQLALVWTDILKPPEEAPGRIQINTVRPASQGVSLPIADNDHKVHEHDFNFLQEKAEAANTWYQWHSNKLIRPEQVPLSLTLLRKKAGMPACLVFLKGMEDLYKKDPVRHMFFKELFLENNSDWYQFLTQENTCHIQALSTMQDNEFTWCETLFRQHAKHNSHLNFSELMTAYLDFLHYLEKDQLLTYLPDTCGITQFKHIKPMLFRLKTILSHADDPKRQLQYVDGLDFGLYGAYYYAADLKQHFEILTKGMALGPSGFSSRPAELCYTLNQDSFYDIVNQYGENYHIISAVYHRMLANYSNDSSDIPYRRLFDYDLYCRLESLIHDCDAQNIEKSSLLYFVFRHTKGRSEGSRTKLLLEDPNLVEPTLRRILNLFGTLQDDNTHRFKHLTLTDLSWINAVRAHYLSRDDMPSLPFMYEVLWLADTSLSHIQTEITLRNKQDIVNLLLSSTGLANLGINASGIRLLFKRINSTLSETHPKLYLRSFEQNFGLLNTILGFFDSSLFLNLIDGSCVDGQRAASTNIQLYAANISQLLMCVDLESSNYYYTNEDIRKFLAALKQYQADFYSNRRTYLYDAFHALIFKLQTINFAHSRLPTMSDMLRLIRTMIDKSDGDLDKINSNVDQILIKICPLLIFDNIGECDWNLPFDTQKLQENEQKLGINNRMLSIAMPADTSITYISTDEIISLGRSIESVQTYYADNIHEYRIFLNAAQTCNLTIPNMLTHLRNLIGHCLNGAAVRPVNEMSRINTSAESKESDNVSNEHHLDIFPELCKYLTEASDESWSSIFALLFDTVRSFESFSHSQRNSLLVCLSHLSITQKQQIEPVIQAIRKINTLASNRDTRELAMSLFLTITNSASNYIQYIERIYASLEQYPNERSKLSRLYQALITHIEEGENRALLDALLNHNLSDDIMRVFSIYQTQYLSFPKLQRLFTAFQQTPLADNDWVKLFKMPPYPSYEFMLELLENPNKKEALIKIQRFDLEPNGITIDPKIFQISTKEKNRLIRVFSKINSLTQQTPLDFSKQAELLQDYLTITLTYGLQFSRTSKDELKKLWNSHQSSLPMHSDNSKSIVLQKMAIMREIYRRITGNFPYCTQMLTLLCVELVPHHVLFQLETGEGKSIVMALMAVWLFTQQSQSKPKAVYIASRNRDLGQQDYIYKKLGNLFAHLRFTVLMN